MNLSKLRQLIEQNGGDALFLEKNRTRLSGLIADYFSDDLRVCNRLKLAVTDNIPARLLKLKNETAASREVHIKQLKQQFIDTYSLDKEKGEETIDWFVNIIFPVSTERKKKDEPLQQVKPATASTSQHASFTDEKIVIEMIAVEGGTFRMGAQRTDRIKPNYDADAWDNESPVHKVTLSDFFIGKYPVTQAQWEAVMGSNPSYFKGDNLPVERVSWYDIVGTSGATQVINGITYYSDGYIYKLNRKTGKKYRLPTDAEWEYAARGGTSSMGYKYSGSNTVGDVAWYWNNSGSKTHKVGTKQANELGIYDMSGNVWEWCADWYGPYSNATQTNPTCPTSDSHRVIRGGSWNYFARFARVSFRGSVSDAPDARYDSQGFRLACSP
jgi:formylglycine-generating enzyme required for sulfatase activity